MCQIATDFFAAARRETGWQCRRTPRGGVWQQRLSQRKKSGRAPLTRIRELNFPSPRIERQTRCIRNSRTDTEGGSGRATTVPRRRPVTGTEGRLKSRLPIAGICVRRLCQDCTALHGTAPMPSELSVMLVSAITGSRKLPAAGNQGYRFDDIWMTTMPFAGIATFHSDQAACIAARCSGGILVSITIAAFLTVCR